MALKKNFELNEVGPFLRDIAQNRWKKATERLQETYMMLKVHGKDCIRAIYIKGANNPNFRRRIYRLTVKMNSRSYVLVHYRECTEDEKPEKHALQPLIAYFISQHSPPPSIATPSPSLPPATPASTTNVAPAPVFHSQSAQYPINASFLESNQDMTFLDEFLDMEVTTPCELDYYIANSGQTMDTSNEIYGPNTFSPNSTQNKLSATYWPSSYWATQNNPSNPVATITDFAPNKISAGMENVKAMACLSSPCTRRDLQMKLSGPSEEKLIDIEWLSDTVLIWQLPLLVAGRWSVSLVALNSELFSTALTWMEVLPAIVSEELTQSVRGKRPLQEESSPPPSVSAPSSMGHDRNIHELPAHMMEHDRQFKIRLVEKLGYMKSALEHDEGSGYRSRSLTREAREAGAVDDGVEWLDDLQVSNLSNQELEAMMDRYIMAVVQQLVQLGSVDEELRAEIDAVDINGLSLFHYCCLYNLNSLIPVLLARGADVNQVTKSGSSPLHLAAAAGHLLVAEVLLNNGANVNALDQKGRTAVDIARLAGQENVYALLSSATNMTSNLSQDNYNNRMAEEEALPLDEDDVAGTAKLLQETFATLSLTDKCALSLSLGQLGGPNANLVYSQMAALGGVPPNQRISFSNRVHSIPSDMSVMATTSTGKDSPVQRIDPTVPSSVAKSKRGSKTGEEISDMQSVLNETDMEYLDAAMSMMGHLERQQVEEEVRKIQNNVRGWLLRKNYMNLREAARVLQSAWRDRKHKVKNEGDAERLRQDEDMMEADGEKKESALHTTPAKSKEGVVGYGGTTSSPAVPNRSEGKTLASLVIQKNLVRWWTQSRSDLLHEHSTSDKSSK
eukprot:scaffold14361_cov193-Ochromonas_danica.AAC.21